MSKSKRNNSNGQVETIQEFLARGGCIKIIPQQDYLNKYETVRKTVSGEPVVIMSLEDAELFYGETDKKKKVKKTKSSLTIDINILPSALRAKFIAKLKEGADGEDYQEELEELESEGDEEEEDTY